MPRRNEQTLREITGEGQIVGPETPQNRRQNRRIRYMRSFRNVMQTLGVDIDNEYGTHERIAYYFIYRAMRDLERIIQEEYPR